MPADVTRGGPSYSLDLSRGETTVTLSITDNVLTETSSSSPGGGARAARNIPTPRTNTGVAIAFEAAVTRLHGEGFWEEPPPPAVHADIETWIRESPFDPTAYQLLADAMVEARSPRAAMVADYVRTLEARTAASLTPPASPPSSAPPSPPIDASNDPFFATLSALATDPAFGFSFSTRAGFLDEARVCDADPVVRADVIAPANGGVAAMPHTLAVHALRRLFTHPGVPLLRSLRIDTAERTTPFAGALANLGHVAAVTHLVVTSDDPDPLSPHFPALTSLASRAKAVDALLEHPVDSLSHLTVRHDKVPIDRLLDRVVAGAPHLRHLGLWDFPLDEAGVTTLAASELLPRLETLDLWARLTPLPTFFEGVLARQDALAHLSALILPRQGASTEAGHRLATWPNVVWADGRRRGAERLDRTTFTALGLGEPAL